MISKKKKVTRLILFNLLLISPMSSKLISRDQWDVEACGRPNKAIGLIKDGQTFKHGQFPWIVAFNQSKINLSYFCGGTLVSLKHVITAAHCMQPKYGQSEYIRFEPAEIIALLGAYDLSYDNEPGRLAVSPEKIHIHREWNPHNVTYDADIALLVFESGKIQSTHIIQPICLWSSRNVLAETLGTVVGWGKGNDPNRRHENLPKKIEVPMFTNEDCWHEIRELLPISSKRTFCAGYRNGTGVCNGDSGSGFFVKSEDAYFLRGIVSSSLLDTGGCDVTKYAVYTNVLKFTNWIAYTMKEGVQPNETIESQDLHFELKQENINSWSRIPLKSSKRVSERKCEEYKNIIATKAGRKHALDEGFKTYDCGSIGFTGLIVGGMKAMAGEFPHMAAIGWTKKEGIKFEASGSLISENYVLTVAHIERPAAPDFVRLGDLDFTTMNDSNATIDIDIKRLIKHPQYDGNKENDIALIELSQPVSFNKVFIRPACLQQSEFFGESFIATGWGGTLRWESSSDSLMKVVIKHRPLGVCVDNLEEELSKKQICAGGTKGKGTCTGDSGAPLQVPHSNARCVYDIVAINSWGHALCASIAPDVHTKVFYYLDWIEKIVWP